MDRPAYGGIGYVIDGTEVSFANRDITQATDAEMERIRVIVEREQDAEIGRTLEEVVIESDYVDRDLVRYRTVTRVHAKVDALDLEPSSPVV